MPNDADLAIKRATRAQLTKCINAANEMLQRVNVEVDDFHVALNNIKTLNESLSNISRETLSEIPSENLDAECVKMLEYEDSAMTVIVKLERRIAVLSLKSIPNVAEHIEVRQPSEILSGNRSQKANSITHRNTSETRQRQVVKFIKLPRLELRKFDGTLKQWPPFWEQFSHAVHDNPDLDNCFKFQYLQSVLSNKAAATISGLAVTESCYNDAIELLKNEFGNQNKIVDSYIHQLLRLPAVKSKNDVGSLRNLYNTALSIIRSLDSMGISSNQYTLIVKSVLLKAIPYGMRVELNKLLKREDDKEESSLNGSASDLSASNSDNNLTKLLDYIKLELESIELAQDLGESNQFQPKSDRHMTFSKHKKRNYFNKETCTTAGLFTSAKSDCLFCKSKSHISANCDNSQTVEEKKSILRTHKRCFRCLGTNHDARNCRTQFLKCKKCSGKHLTTMCDPNCNKLAAKSRYSLNAMKNDGLSPENATNLMASNQAPNVYLQTGKVLIMNENASKPHLIRIVFDGGSQLSFIKTDISRKFGLPVIGKQKLSILCFGSEQQTSAKLCNIVRVTLKSQHSNALFEMDVVEIPEIYFDTLSMPPVDHPILDTLKLADTCVSSNVPSISGISILIGADNYWLLHSGRTIRLDDKLTAVDTKFGWTVHVPVVCESNAAHCNLATVLQVQSLKAAERSDLNQLWDLESIGIREIEISGCKFTDDFIKNKIKFVQDRYKVSLPWKNENSVLRSNYNGALCRLNSLTKKLLKVNRFAEYDKAIREYIDYGYAEEASFVNEDIESRLYIMPHRPVYRDDKETTRTRVVFDASAYGYAENSLNDLLHKGENLVPLLVKILLNFRIGNIALVSDIEKAFLQILLDENDYDSHSFLWYDKNIIRNGEFKDMLSIKRYRMKRVTFGITCSPFLLSVVLKHHINIMKADFKDSCAIMENNFYVDDFVTSVDDYDSAVKLYEESKMILSKAGMNLRKWQTNDIKLRQYWNENNSIIGIKKMLGVESLMTNDQLCVNLLNIKNDDTSVTKRTILKAAAKVYDPLGLLCPFTLKPKLILQDLWKLNTSWDDSAPTEVVCDWKKWLNQLLLLNEFTIPRCCLPTKYQAVQLHVFADASLRAYGAVAYIRSVSQSGENSCKFLMAKNRIAPINKMKRASRTLPELELTALSCAVRLSNFIVDSMRVSISSVTVWSDSQIALSCIVSQTKKQKPYVTHRVDEIQRTFKGKLKFVPGHLNPADLLTRSVNAKVLLESDAWKNGPEYLQNEEFINEDWYSMDYNEITSVSVRVNFATNSVQCPEPLFKLETICNLEKALRVTAYIHRFVSVARKKYNPQSLVLDRDELLAAEIYWLKYAQSLYYADEVEALRSNRFISKSSSILCLNPFLDDHGLLRVGSRLGQAELPYEVKYPVILPKQAEFTAKLIWKYHLTNQHCGTSSTLSLLRQKYWIIAARQKIKSILSKCVTWKKLKGKHGDEVFAPLPKDRLLSECRPFTVTGVDFFGLLYVSDNNLKTKVYVLLLTCAVSRGIHLELVPDLSTESCIRAMRRFVSRRGVADVIISDNAKTFKRCAVEIQRLCEVFMDHEVQNFAGQYRIKWKFIVERAAWWGGFWERLIRSVKNALKLSLGKALICADELSSVLAEIEALINTRPLTYMESSIDNFHALSPSSILIGVGATGFNLGFPEDTSRDDILKIWNLRNRLSLKFWKRWSRDYMQQLASFHKNRQANGPKFSAGDVAMLHDDNKPRIQWKLVRLVAPITGRDGKIRAYTFKTSSGAILKRPIQLLYPLEIFPTVSSPAPREDVVNRATLLTECKARSILNDIAI